MRSGLWVMAVAALLGGGVAMAQGGPVAPGGPGGHPPQAPQGRPPGGNPPAARPPGGHQRPPANHRPPVNHQRPPAQRPPASHRPPPRPPGFRPQQRPPHHFMSQGRWRPSIRGPRFLYPPGYGYRLWITGAILPGIFLSGSYFFGDYASLGLAPPPPGYRWVRYGPDLLLVNVLSGRIADVVEGVFY